MIYRNIKKIFLAPFWKTAADSGLEGDNFCVIMGFPRSGTSLLSELVEGCGYNFGAPANLKKGNPLNPNGFFENLIFFRLNDRFLKQAGLRKSYGLPTSDLSAKSFFNKIGRFFTRVRMISFLNKISSNGKVALKSTPLNFYFFRKYIPKTKIVGIYRNPLVVSHSNLKVFGRGRTFVMLLNDWKTSVKEMIYHSINQKGIILSYEDLIDPAKQDGVLGKLTNYLGEGSVLELKKKIKTSLNHSESEAAKLFANYPVDKEVKEVFESVEKIKI